MPTQTGTGSSNTTSNTNQTLAEIIAHLRGSVTGSVTVNSPYAPYVTISTEGARNTDPAQQYVTIHISSSYTGQLPLSSWRIDSPVSALGATLGSASSLPISGQINDGPFTVGANSTIYVVTGRSPEGESFRENLCSGYFSNAQTFVPYLNQQCPSGTDELTRAAQSGFIPSDACINYVKSLYSCKLVIANFPTTLDSACENFITTTLTYNGCVDAHRTDANFYQNTWYVYLNRSGTIWKSSNEVIRLVDENGKVVATAAYQ